MIIAIDGPSGTGKTTIARKLAERLKVQYFDTGATYRAITVFFMARKVNLDDLAEIEKNLKEFTFSF